jgi:hypothetical protein
LTVDKAITAWESMLADANAVPPPPSRWSANRGHALVALRMTALLVLAALAILVLLPAALAAQLAFAG